MRLSSSSPNIQNCPARGWGKDIKKIFVPPPGKVFLSCDASQLELRIVLYEAGVDPKEIKGDAFQWLVDKAPEAFDKAAKIVGTTPRQMAKTVSHASSYLTGIKLFDYYEVKTPVIQSQIKSGALEIHEDWDYCGKLVGFTGVRLAEILFRLNKKTPKGEALEMRRKALQIQKYYFDNFPIRSWHKRLLKEAERGYIQTKWGSYLTLIETNGENAKIAAAKIGQGEGAEYVQGKQIEALRIYENTDVTMDAQVHDEILWSIPMDYPRKKIKDIVDLLHGESHRFPGFVCPWVAKMGPNWGDVEKIQL